MNCQRCSELIVDVLYGEDIGSRKCFDFFEHLAECAKCRGEYVELVETREMLSDWGPEEEISGLFEVPQSAPPRPRTKTLLWWPLFQKIAAGLLILVGALALLQNVGIVPAAGGTRITDKRLAEVVHDATVARQEEDWRLIAEALLEIREDLEARSRVEMREVYEDLQNFEERYVYTLEENTRQAKTRIGR